MNIPSIKNLDINNIGSWPWYFKAVVIGIFSLVLQLGVYKLVLENYYRDLAANQDKEIELKDTLKSRHAKAVHLDTYRAQMQEMKQSFGAMLRQLPNKTEVADLLVDISQTGLAAGLEFELFKPEQEAPADFYAELPIKIKVTGSYHEFGSFISGIAALPRIVTVHNFSISPSQNKTDKLVMESTAKTYRYLDENEIMANKKKKDSTGKAGSKNATDRKPQDKSKT